MVFHVGIAPLLGQMALFNTETSRTKISDFREVGKNNIDEIDGMFKRIKATTKSEKLGCAGIYVGSSYGNEIRQKFIQIGLECGFEKIEIIDWETQMFLNAISQIDFQPKNGDIICVLNGKLCHFWHKEEEKLKYHGSDNGIFNDANDSTDKETDKDPNVIIYEANDDTDNQTVVRLFPQCHVFSYDHNDAMGALIKARIMAKDDNVLAFKCQSKLDRNLTVKIGERKIMTFEPQSILPSKKSINLKVDENDKILSIASGYFDDRIMSDIILPINVDFALTVTIDTNGIVFVDF